MHPPNPAATIAGLSHHPAGIETVRAATSELGVAVEFVLLDSDRAIVIAAVGPASLQPRLLLAPERELLGLMAQARAPVGAAAAVDLGQAGLGALSCREPLATLQQEQLRSHAHNLAVALAKPRTQSIDDLKKQALVLGGMRDTVLVLTPEFNIDWCNDAVMTLLGWTPQEVIGRSATDLIHPDDVNEALDAAVRLHEANRIYRVNLRLRDANNNWVEAVVTGLDHSDNELIGGFVLSLRNNDVETEMQQARDRQRRVSTTILQNLNEAVVATDEVGDLTTVNAAARQMFSIDESRPVASLTVADFPLLNVHGFMLDASEHPLTGGSWVTQELRTESSSGLRSLSVSRSLIAGEAHHLGVVATFHDITQALSDARELRNSALHDQLTGLANRRFLSERLASLAETGNVPSLAACFIDIDKFKNVNDIHGHRVGDNVLQMTARRLGRHIRDTDILARPGGDEFLIILVDPESPQTALDVASRMRAALAEPFEIEGNRLHLTASVGIAMHSSGTLDVDGLLRDADIALYAAKDAGRDRVEVFDQTLATAVALETRQRNMVRSALDNGRLQMYFQPIVDETGRTVGVEALARCEAEDGSIIEPSGFIEAIEGTSLIVRLDRAGFEQSCQFAALLSEQADTRHIWVSANFSAMALAQSDFASQVLDTIERSGVAATSICVEVTETAAFEAGEGSIRALAALHAAGVRIALDDFGTGYSSLAHLRDLPLSTVKIDRSFTSELCKHGPERAIATAVGELAKSLGFSVVAEGVETVEDEQAVKDIGVESMQGWRFAKALPVNEVLDRLTLDGQTERDHSS